MSETKALATYLVNSRLEDIPEDVRHESRRALLNYIGCAVGGSQRARSRDCAHALSSLISESPRPASWPGRNEWIRCYAALINGISSHVFEYDDTMPKNYIHPTPPVASAIFAYASANRVSADAISSMRSCLGFETEARVGNAVYPAHYDAGWHITSTAGVFGAAAAIGKLLGLSIQQMIWALGLAATQASGLREMFGYMAKSFHAGRAAQNGYAGAVMAQSDFTAGERSIEGPRGFAAVQAAKYDLSKITDGLGTDFQIRYNAYKPYPCGLVVHPAIDGCIDLYRDHHPAPDSIKAVRVRVAPLVMDLCNKKDITRGLEGKYSIYHSCAVGLVRGKAGLQEYTDAAVNDPAVKSVRERVTAIADTSITEDQAHIEVELQDGRKLVRFIEQSLGNVHRPLSDRQLEDKLRDQCIPALSCVASGPAHRTCAGRSTSSTMSNELVKATVRS